MLKLLISAAAAAAIGITSAQATTFIFKGDGGLQDVPTGNIALDCGSVGADYCTADDTLGFAYAKDGISFTVKAFANNLITQLIQDISPANSGLGALSEADASQDQTQFGAAEAIEFVFNQVVTLTNLEFNQGDETDCSAAAGGEGPCGNFDLFIDNVLFANLAAVDLLAGGFTGTTFRFVATTPGAGFALAQFAIDQQVIPLPAAWPLLLSGVAGLTFSARRRKPRKA